MSVAPPGAGSAKPCAASAMRRARATESDSGTAIDEHASPVVRHFPRGRPPRRLPGMALGFVRPARPGDAGEIARVQLSTWRTAYRRMLPAHVLASLDEAYLTRGWEEAITAAPSPRHRVLVAVEQG